MKKLDIYGYICLTLSLSIWYHNGAPTTLSFFLNGMALGFFGKNIYNQIKSNKER